MPRPAPARARGWWRSRRTPTARSLRACCIEGASPYDFTAQMLAWGAMRAADRGLSGSGALGPVEAYGLDELERGAAQAGIGRVDGVGGR